MATHVEPIPPNEQTEDQPGQRQHREADRRTKGAKAPANVDKKRKVPDRSDRRPDRGARPDEDTVQQADDADLRARDVEPIGDVENSVPNGANTDTGLEGDYTHHADDDVR